MPFYEKELNSTLTYVQFSSFYRIGTNCYLFSDVCCMLPCSHCKQLSAFMTHEENLFNSLIKKFDVLPEHIKQQE
jgi:hypothetical protein